MSLVEQSHRADDGRGIGPAASHGQPGRWARVKALFLEALQYAETERSAFVMRAAGDDAELRKEVDALLASDAAAGSFCEVPAAALLGTLEPEEPPARLVPGTRLGPYEITNFIAAGGMGAVYRAQHAVLGRDVAIKTVGASAILGAQVKRRLIREARHASLLTHPNICAIYDVGEAEGLPFIVMEYVNGKPLGEIIRGSLPPVPTALKYAADVAAALEHAHQRGIIHRDLKSANVVVNAEDRAVVLDFGLARHLAEAGGSPRSESTLTIDTFAGTLSHMAPELLRGERADARSDVWSFGVLLYELLTGELPFSGGTQFETSSAILGDPPKPLSARVPLALRLIVERCLIKDRRGRYGSAHEVREAIDAVRRQRTWLLIGPLLISTRRRTLYAAVVAALGIIAFATEGPRLRAALAAQRLGALAVLPLENATGDPTATYYADGVTDAIIAQLGAASDLRIFSRASAMRVAGTTTSSAEIGSRLGADVLVRGRLRRPNDSIAVDVNIVRSADGRMLWSASYQRGAREVLGVEADVVRGIASAIRASLPAAARERLLNIRAVTPEVYEAYLKGRYEWSRRTPGSLQRAIGHFKEAVELDPTYAPAHAGLADCYNQLGTVMVGGGSPNEFRPLAAAEAIKALQIDPYSAEAHAALGYVWHYDLRWADAERELRRAIELNPNFALARIWYANLLMSRRRMKEATEQVYAARDLDPFSPVINTNVGWVLYYSGRYADAIAQLEQTLALDSTYVQAHSRLADALLAAGRLTEAREQVQRVLVLRDSSPQDLAMVAALEAYAGRRDSARVLLRELISRASHQYIPPVSIALRMAQLGDVDTALIWLEKAFAERSNAIAYLAVEPTWAPLRGNPRFELLLDRAGLK
ncbi:MAG TPA: protein kinase [Gemmatimonadaceae bacterium]|jgi:serine/threonine-protein kinase